ncbi:MAG: hypothetical protein EOP06_25325, partial [Proteobacteria bacterium]
MKLLLWMLLASFQFAAEAQTSTSTLKLPEILKDKKYEDSHQITDARLRAEAGSLSRYSFKFDMKYDGASVETPLGKEQPNPD